MPPRPLPVLVTRRRGFSLVLSLTVMAMLLLLCISIAALMLVEMRVGRAAVSQARARYAALAGARIALGEIQRLMGPDQRVSATADILCNPDQKDPMRSDYYDNAKDGVVTHPRWVGVWNAGRVKDIDVSGVDSDEENKVIQRTKEGVLKDSRYADNRKWEDLRAAKNPGSASPRLMGWLVSGAEGVPGGGSSAGTNSAKAVTPFSAITAGAEVELLATAALASYVSPDFNKTDGRGARARLVALPDAVGAKASEYAYWVDDEGVKARFNLRDKFEKLTPNPAQAAAGGYNRLMLPQRQQFEGVSPMVGALASKSISGYAQLTGDQVEQLSGFDALGMGNLPSLGLTGTELKSAFYHDFSFVSAGVLSDTAAGGLRRDLTPYLDKGEIPDASGVAGTGILDATKLLPEKYFARISPTLGMIRDWAGAANRPDFNATALPIRPPSTYSPGTPYPIPDYSNPKGVSSLAPVVAGFSFHLQFCHDASQSGANTIRALLFPRVVLWNPYSVPISLQGVQFRMLRKERYDAFVQTSSTQRYQIVWPSWYSPTPMMLSFGNATLQPGDAVVFVPPKPAGSYVADAVTPHLMVPGDPADFGSYSTPAVTSSQRYDSNQKKWVGAAMGASDWATLTTGSHRVTMGAWTQNDVAGCASYVLSNPNQQLYLLKDGAAIQQLDMEHFTRGNLGTWFSPGMNEPFNSIAVAKAKEPWRKTSVSNRLLWLDDVPAVNPADPVAGIRNTNFNGLADYNYLAARHTRHPFDMITWGRVNHAWNFGLITTEGEPASTVDNNYAPAGSRFNVSPVFSAARLDAAAPGFVIRDVPRKETGILSLGALQNAPLNITPFGTATPVGNGRLHPSCPTDSTGLGLTDEALAWAETLDSAGTPQAVRDVFRRSEGGVKSLTLFDWSYELNHSLWDAYHFSGMPESNAGWSRLTAEGLPAWQLDGTDSSASRNSRWVEATHSAGGSYFSQSNYKAYQAAYSLLQKGQFNVNSTSVPAWQSLLASFRDIPVSAKNGDAMSSGRTAFSRLLWPLVGDVTATTPNPTYSGKTWGGYRSLSDQEIRLLAEKIVREVKARGPFLSLADFVNRRLKPTEKLASSESDVDDWQRNYLGVIQSAINQAKINDHFDVSPTELAYLNRLPGHDFYCPNSKPTTIAAGIGWTAPDPVREGICRRQVPQHRAKHKADGAPGYLSQADVLQKIGPVLSARSDTFVVRACGRTEDGASAYVELVVQRTPQPVQPDDRLPINPESVESGAYAGNQLWGRRFTVVSTRWLNATDL